MLMTRNRSTFTLYDNNDNENEFLLAVGGVGRRVGKGEE